jgi:hypothetical protein
MWKWDASKTDFLPDFSDRGGRNFEDITGRTFGRVTAKYPIRLKRRVYWICVCSCGKELRTGINSLKRGNTKSCGCWKIEKTIQRNKNNRKGCGDLYGHHISNIKFNARLRNLEYNLTDEYLWNLFLQQERKCKLSGVELGFGSHGFKTTASLDRIDPFKGYVEGNVQWVHKDINRMRLEKTVDEFLEICRKVVTYNELEH